MRLDQKKERRNTVQHNIERMFPEPELEKSCDFEEQIMLGNLEN